MKSMVWTFFVSVFLVSAFSARAQVPDEYKDAQIKVRTNAFGENNVVAVTNDGRFFAIVCTRGLIYSGAELVFPNSLGDLSTDHYKGGSRNPLPISTFATLNDQAVKEICNRPNGIYVLHLHSDSGQFMADYVSGQSLDADSGRSRGF